MFAFVILLVMAEVPMKMVSRVQQGSGNNDSIPTDSIVKDTIKAAFDTIKATIDTTQMDSIQLAIYRHNKAIDDSLAQDSINKRRKNGIDSPVEYSAEDSLTYEAASGLAHLYGDSKVKYQNMDLQSDKIYMSLDSSLVHATGSFDSTANELKGTPVSRWVTMSTRAIPWPLTSRPRKV